MIIVGPHQILPKCRRLDFLVFQAPADAAPLTLLMLTFRARHRISHLSSASSGPLCRSFALFCSADPFVFNTFWSLFCKTGGRRTAHQFLQCAKHPSLLAFPMFQYN